MKKNTTVSVPALALAAILALGASAALANESPAQDGAAFRSVEPEVEYDELSAAQVAGDAKIAGCCAKAWGMSDGKAYKSRATGYYPDSSAMEGGYVDMHGANLRTLQGFLGGSASYVSTAMDPKVLHYGAQICIPELNATYGTAIKFKVVDTGGAFYGKGMSRIDVCTKNYSASVAESVNRSLTIIVCQ